MSQQPPFEPSLRPVAPNARWWILGIVFVLLAAWEAAFHRWFMDLPMITGHRLNALIAAGLVALVVLATFVLIQRYEQRLAALADELKRKNEALRALEAERDTRLVDLARDLALALAEIVTRCEVARGLPESVNAVEEFAAIEARAHVFQTVISSMIDLKHEGAGLTEVLPSILEEYQRHREAHPKQPPLSRRSPERPSVRRSELASR
jgi:hypothetical protein